MLWRYSWLVCALIQVHAEICLLFGVRGEADHIFLDGFLSCKGPICIGTQNRAC